MGSRIGVIGGGIVGLAIARQLGAVVLEKEDDVARHQTGHNSGVAHAGLYYTPGSLKARLCRRGITLLRDHCHTNGIPYVECGKVVVARDAAEVGRLREIARKADTNGVPRLRWLDGPGLHAVEPHVRGVAGLHSPETAIVDFTEVARSFARDVEVRLNFEVTAIDSQASSVTVRSAQGEELGFDRLVVCAGLQSDRVARLAGDAAGPAIIPFRGEYYRLAPRATGLVRGLIYPVPDPRYPFLGIHLTRRVDGTVDVGPNAVLAGAREGYDRRRLDAGDLWDTVRWSGFRRLALTHWRTGVKEVYGSLSKRAFVAAAQAYVPELTLADVEPGGSGVRAQAVDADGSLVDDFRINHLGRVTTIRNAPSPAATSSMAIAEHVKNEMAAVLA